jgi:hypothetical protein
MYRIMNGIIALSQAMELGRLTKEAAKTASPEGLFAPLNLTEPTLWDTDGGYQSCSQLRHQSSAFFASSDRMDSCHRERGEKA